MEVDGSESDPPQAGAKHARPDEVPNTEASAPACAAAAAAAAAADKADACQILVRSRLCLRLVPVCVACIVRGP